MILFVASNPSHLNTDPDIPFKGSRSEPIFNKWLDYLNLTQNCVKNNNVTQVRVINVSNIVTPNNRPLRVSEYDLQTLKIAVSKASKVIPLGRTAEDALRRIKANFIAICHPSPLNRKLNDKKYVDKMLNVCQNYIHDKNV